MPEAGRAGVGGKGEVNWVGRREQREAADTGGRAGWTDSPGAKAGSFIVAVASDVQLKGMNGSLTMTGHRPGVQITLPAAQALRFGGLAREIFIR